MRTNIFITNTTVAPDFVEDVASMTTNMALIKALASNEVNTLKKNFNLCWLGSDSRYANFGNRETRLIPISTCGLVCKDTLQRIAKYNERYVALSLDFGETDLSGYVNEEMTIRVIIPVGFNHRNTWNFSYVVKNDSTAEDIVKSLLSQVAASSIKEWLEVEYDATNSVVKFYVNDKVNDVYVKPLDSMSASWISVVNTPAEDDATYSTEPGSKVELITREYLKKLVIDADANYGFDYINCPDGDFYPNKLRPRDVDYLLDNFVNIVEGEFGGTLGLTHLTFVEPRIVETTGHVVKQVINILHPIKDVGDFVYADYQSMIEKIAGTTFANISEGTVSTNDEEDQNEEP